MDLTNEKTIISSIFIVLILLLTYMLFAIFYPKDLTAKQIFNKNANSVVEIMAKSDAVGESYGTGEFIHSHGTIVTNAHVVTYSKLGEATTFDEYFIRFMDSDDYLSVTLIKYDRTLDIAVLEFASNAHKFKRAEINTSTKIQSGDAVFAIGNAMNYGLAISSGIISIPLVNISYGGISRKVIQCDITIAEGNSGGALFDSQGRLIGITTFRTKDNSGDVVYGFAYCIPITTVLEYVNQE